MNALGWRLGCQAYTFRHFTLFETIDKNAALGLKYLEIYPTQRFRPEDPDVKVDHHSPDDVLEAVRQKCASAGVKLVNYGCVRLPNDETETRSVFEFAKKMGIETLVSEPEFDALDLIDTLCQEYAINLAIHNHPAPSIYWNPDTVLKACQGRSQYFGACADTGHWVRSQFDPLEALKKLEGRIVSLHLKDVIDTSPHSTDVPWGTGLGKVTELLKELKRQGISPVFSIEYEVQSDATLYEEVAECVRFFNRASDELGQ